MMKENTSLSFITLLFTLACFFSLFISNSFGQTQPDTEREKVHLHFDKPSYIAGDTIWFKAYVVMGGSNTPSTKSKTLHVDVFNEHQKVINSMLLRISSGLASGDIILPDTLQGGNLHIRAYTSQMSDFGPAAYFNRTIPIINLSAQEVPPGEMPPGTGKSDVSFFPEGGDAVAGLRSKVGLKVIGSNGLGEQVSGEVVDQDGKLIADFKTESTGIGVFPLTPAAGKKYMSIIKLTNGRTMLVPIPAALPQGYLLTINNRLKDSVSVNISLSNDLLGQSAMLLAQTDQMVYYSVKMTLKAPVNTLSIPRNELPAGVVRLTLLSAQNEPLAERLIFNTNGNDLKLKVNTKNNYAPAEQALLETTDALGKPLTGSFSVAVTSREKVTVNDDDVLSIQANLLLVSDLRGTIEHPNYYFNAKNDTDSADRYLQLDNLLLTQGWRKFVWKRNVIDSSSKRSPAPEDGLHISGKLLTSTKKPIANSRISVYATIDGFPFLADTLTGNDGRFRFNDLDYDDQTKFVIQAKNVKNKNDVRIVLDTLTIAPPMYTTRLNDRSSKVYTGNSKAHIKELVAVRLSGKTTQLKQVDITAKKPSKSGMPGGTAFAYNVIKNNKIKGYINLKGVIEQSNPFIRFNSNNEPIYEPKTDDSKSSAIRTGRNGFHRNFVTMVDGALSTDNYALQTISPEDVESIEIYMDGTSVGVLDKGVIAINIKKKGNKFGGTVSGMLTFPAKGYTKTREFYSPKYADKSAIPDIRDVIYWNPNVTINNDKKAEVRFYNSNNKGDYDVVVEGVTTDGRLARAVYTYSVK